MLSNNVLCEICNSPFRNKALLNRHMRTHVTEMLQPVQPVQHEQVKKTCNDCGKSITSKNFARHQKTCQLPPQPKVKDRQCLNCNKFFTSQGITNHSNSCAISTRKCTRCQIVKPKTEFYDGKYRCKECLKAQVRCNNCSKVLLERNFSRHAAICVI